ncbi:MAG: T9SS type A sorting domain-containing protein [Flavobacteriales bacterium]|nr:T9SS type A sorting domain-containing protein [Flavobacteriales bacterium]
MKDLFVTIICSLSISTSVAQWQQISDFEVSGVQCLLVDGQNIYAGTNDGIYLSTDTGSTWNTANNGMFPSADIHAFINIGSNVFAGVNDGATVGIDDGVALSSDTGSSWVAVNNGLPTDPTISSFAKNGSGLYAGSNPGVWKTTNNGSSWSQLSIPTNSTILSLATNGSHVFAGTDGAGLYHSTNNGSSWSWVGNVFDNNDHILSLVTDGSTVFAGTDGGVYRSTDNGSNWVDLNTLNLSVYSMVISNGIIYAAIGSGGVYVSSDNGDNWSAFNTGFTNTSIRSLAAADNYIYAGNGISQVWKYNTCMPVTPTVAITGSTTFCEGDSVVLTSSSTTGNLWSYENQESQSVAVYEAGSYFVTVTDENGCTASSQPLVVTVNPNPPEPSISLSGASIFCQGDSVILTSSSADSYLWSNASTNQSITVQSSGDYSIVVTDANGCSSTSSETMIVAHPLPSPVLDLSGSLTFCQGDSVIISSSISADYLWSNGATTQTITALNSGEYSVTVVDGNGCSATSDTAVVLVNDLPPTPTISSSGPTVFCDGDSVILTSSIGDNYSWSIGLSSQSITVTDSDIYSVTVSDGNGCEATSSDVEVIVNALPVVPTISASGSTTICEGDSILLTASVETEYLWFPNGETTQSIYVSSADDYYLTVENSFGCSATSLETTVVVNPLPVAPEISLNGTTLESDVPNGNQWYFEGAVLTGETNQTYTPTQNGYYYILLTDNNGCQAFSDSISLLTVGLSGNDKDSQISIFPNPAFDKISIQTEVADDYSFELYDAVGKLVDSSVFFGQLHHLTISELNSGLYLLFVTNVDGRRETFRILKE